MARAHEMRDDCPGPPPMVLPPGSYPGHTAYLIHRENCSVKGMEGVLFLSEPGPDGWPLIGFGSALTAVEGE